MVIHVAGPHEALVKSTRGRQPQIVIGGRCIVIPGLQELGRLSLHLRTIIVRSEQAVTLNRVSMEVVSCCQVKIRAWIPDESETIKVDTPALRLAAEHFLQCSESQIDSAIHDTMEGHQRAIVATLSAEDLYRNRAKFVATVREITEADLAGMGVALVSYTVQKISDEAGYMTSLGETPVAAAKRAAAQAVAEYKGAADAYVAERNAGAQEVEDAQRERIMRSDGARAVWKLNAQAEVNEKETVANAAYGIQLARQDREVFRARQQKRVACQKEENETERIHVEREQLRNEAQRNVVSDAQLYLQRMQAQADLIRAKAEADKIRMIGEAEAECRDCIADIEAELIHRRVDIFNKCENDTFFAAEIIEKLPELARAQYTIPASSTMTFVGGAEPAVVSEVSELSDVGMTDLLSGSEADAEVDITRALSTASRSGPVRAAATLLGLRALRNRFSSSCLRERDR